VSRTLWESASLADVDFDGDLEIAVPTTNGRVYLKHHDGTDLPNWPIADPSAPWIKAVTIANVIGTVEPELIFSTDEGRVHLYQTDGDEVNSWPNSTGCLIYGSPIADNVWDDPGYGVVVGASDGLIHGWKNMGSDIPGWPKELLGPITGAPAAGDVDNDGRLEIVFGTTNSLEMVDLNNPPSEWGGWFWRMANFNAQRTSCLNCNLDALLGVDDEELTQANRVRFLGGFPNPASESLRLRYKLPAYAAVSLRIYDVAGRLIRNLMREEQGAGEQAILWDGLDDHGIPVSSGIYFARLAVRGPGVENSFTRAVSIMR
jgi:hypothetical protein